jgi:hypothetical protein
MTFKEKYNSLKRWQSRIAIMNFYHQIKCAQNDKWSIRQTAKYFQCSIGLVSENLQLAKRYDEIKLCVNRKEALLLMRNKNE